MTTPVHAAVLRPEDTASHVGEEVTVEGQVESVVCSPLACLLSFSTDFSGLVASIDGGDVPRFPPPRETFTERRVRVQGTIVERNGRLRLDLRDPAQISVLDASGGAPVAERAAAPTAGMTEGEAPPVNRSRIVAPTRVTTRAGGPRASEPRAPDPALAGIAATTDPVEFELRALRQQITRLEETTRALSETVAALEERIVVLEQQGGGTARSTADPSLLPEVPSYVVAGKSSRRVQHVKRGWTSERLMRALGAPVRTVTGPNGYMTWYYENGAVTLDSRGRVTSSVGF